MEKPKERITVQQNAAGRDVFAPPRAKSLAAMNDFLSLRKESSLQATVPAPSHRLVEGKWPLNQGTLAQTPFVYEQSKRTTDAMIALFALFFLAPMGVLIALLISCESEGPIFYGQDRIGKDGKRFRFYKFRSMVVNADQIRSQLETHNEAVGPIFKMKNDPRITKVGRILRKYSLDELPQFWNVFRGDMSLVGPRPHLPKEVAQYHEQQQQRLTVRPGLVCLREVCGRSRLTFEEWMALDLLYIRYRSVALDVWILLRLIPAVISADGAY